MRLFFQASLWLSCLFVTNLLLAASNGSKIAAVVDGPGDSQKNLVLSLNLIWEGGAVVNESISQLKEYRKTFPQVRFNHFISPAYFLRLDADAEEIKSQIDSVTKKGDNFGVALYGWKSMVNGAKVIYRGSPTFWGHEKDTSFCQIDCGRNTPVTIYSQTELDHIIRFAKHRLEAIGFGSLRSIYTSGWMTSTYLLEAAKKNDINFDFSEIPTHLVAAKLKGYPILKWIEDHKQNIAVVSQPWMMKLQEKGIVIVPNNWGALDYLSEGKLNQIGEKNIELLRTGTDDSRVLSLSVFQESALKYMGRLTRVTNALYDRAIKSRVKIVGLTLEEADLRFSEKPHVSAGNHILENPNYDKSISRFSH